MNVIVPDRDTSEGERWDPTSALSPSTPYDHWMDRFYEPQNIRYNADGTVNEQRSARMAIMQGIMQALARNLAERQSELEVQLT